MTNRVECEAVLAGKVVARPTPDHHHRHGGSEGEFMSCYLPRVKKKRGRQKAVSSALTRNTSRAVINSKNASSPASKRGASALAKIPVAISNGNHSVRVSNPSRKGRPKPRRGVDLIGFSSGAMLGRMPIETAINTDPIPNGSWVGKFSPNTVVNADCLVTLKEMPQGCVDLTVFSPPYDSVRDYTGNWSLDFRALGEELLRVTKDGGVAAVVIGDGTKDFAKSLTTFRWAVDWVDRAGWRLFECCVYARHGNPGAWWTQRFRVDHEYILIFFKGSRPRFFDKEPLKIQSKHAGKIYSGTDRLTNGGFKKIEPKAVNDRKCRGTVWQYATSNTEGNRLKLGHPATFPDLLAEDLIRCFSAPGAMVLDPMAGSGTTCVMAAKNGRQFFGIEISPDYHMIAQQRLKAEVEDARGLF